MTNMLDTHLNNDFRNALSALQARAGTCSSPNRVITQNRRVFERNAVAVARAELETLASTEAATSDFSQRARNLSIGDQVLVVEPRKGLVRSGRGTGYLRGRGRSRTNMGLQFVVRTGQIVQGSGDHFVMRYDDFNPDRAATRHIDLRSELPIVWKAPQ